MSFRGTLYVGDDRISDKWNLVTKRGYSIKENEEIVVVTPRVSRLTSEQIDSLPSKEIERSTEITFSKISKWFNNIWNWIQRLQWVQKIIDWFSKNDGTNT